MQGSMDYFEENDSIMADAMYSRWIFLSII